VGTACGKNETQAGKPVVPAELGQKGSFRGGEGHGKREGSAILTS